MSAAIARGQASWLALFGEPTVPADAPAATAPVMAVRLIPADDPALFQGVEYDSTRWHLVCAKGALGDIEPEAIVVHGETRVRIQGGPIAIPPDGGLVAYPVLVGEG